MTAKAVGALTSLSPLSLKTILITSIVTGIAGVLSTTTIIIKNIKNIFLFETVIVAGITGEESSFP